MYFPFHLIFLKNATKQQKQKTENAQEDGHRHVNGGYLCVEGKWAI